MGGFCWSSRWLGFAEELRALGVLRFPFFLGCLSGDYGEGHRRFFWWVGGSDTPAASSFGLGGLLPY